MKKMIISLISLSIGISATAFDLKDYNFDYDITSLQLDLEVPKVVMELPAAKNASEVVDHFKYFPIFKKIRYEYEYESTDFTGKKKIIVEFNGYSEKDSVTTAIVTYYNKKDIKTIEFPIRLLEKGIYSRDIILGIERFEIPIPLFKDKRWSENGNENRVIGFSSRVQTSNNVYENCLKILTHLKSSEFNKIERYYAPGIGLVKEVIKSEDKTDIITLVNFLEK
ncbi:MAG: hypothetical protein K6357_08810 [Elusimicrobiota bacterium]